MLSPSTAKSFTQKQQYQRSQGEACLYVKNIAQKTHIDRLYQQGCAKLRVPTPRSKGLEAIMINSSGGMTGGDRLKWCFKARDDTALTITTQACERIYAALSDIAITDVELDVGPHAKIAWLPQETLVFNDGAFSRNLEVDMAQSSELLLVEPVIFGRQAMGEHVETGLFKDRWRIRQNGQLIHAEQALFKGSIANDLQRKALGNGALAFATILLIAPHAEALLSRTHALIGGYGSASFWNGKLLARIAAPSAYQLRRTLTPLIHFLNHDTPLPKIWHS